MNDTIMISAKGSAYFARKVNEWAKRESELRGRDVTLWEAFARWCDYVHPNGRAIAESCRKF